MRGELTVGTKVVGELVDVVVGTNKVLVTTTFSDSVVGELVIIDGDMNTLDETTAAGAAGAVSSLELVGTLVLLPPSSSCFLAIVGESVSIDDKVLVVGDSDK